MLVYLFDKIYNQSIFFNSFFKFFYIDKLYRKIFILFSNAIIPLYYIFTFYCLKKLTPKENNELIVSLTTVPSRLSKIWIVIESILRQSFRPNRIILWLSKEQFKSDEALPFSILRLQKYGLEIKYVDNDIKSHKKYYYCLINFPDSEIITIDDDIFYPENFIENLISFQKRNIGKIICHRASEIPENILKNLTIDTWQPVCKSNEFKNLQIFFTTGGGVLFNKNQFHSDVCNYNLFMKLCPYADDIWLNVMASLNGTKIIKTDYYSLLLPILIYKKTSLSTINNLKKKNSIQLFDTLIFFNLNKL